jgi:hypothetical protein
MRKHGFLILGIVFLCLFLCFWFWYAPVGGKLSQGEIDHYMAMAEKVAAPPDAKQQMLTNLRAWCEADNGKPVYMLNLLRDYKQLKKYSGTPAFNGTPEQANKLYEKKVMPFLLKRASFIAYYGKPVAKNLSGFAPEVNDFSEVLIVRYPNRRAFVDMMADPDYAPVVVYKFMGTEINLVPTESIAYIPDMRLVVGGLLLFIYMAIGWYLAARRSKASEKGA